MGETKVLRKPEWLKIPIRQGGKMAGVEKLLKEGGLNTVCQEANCPNRMECYSQKTATFMILGSICTRDCRFCDVQNGQPGALDREEAKKVAQAVETLGLRLAVVTSVTRDDLEDGGASVFADLIREVHKIETPTRIEVLIPDFKGDLDALKTVVAAKPDILNHNTETVPRLYSTVRPQANYERSLALLKQVKEIDPGVPSKTGIMVGLGETEDEVLAVFRDLREQDVDFLTIGQYLCPSKNHLPVVEYVTPEQFQRYYDLAKEMGFKGVASGPFVRSSYKAVEMLDNLDSK